MTAKQRRISKRWIQKTREYFREFLDETCITVTGSTVHENLKEVEIANSNIILPINKPLWSEGALTILKGNLAPRGGVTRHTVKIIISNRLYTP